MYINIKIYIFYEMQFNFPLLNHFFEWWVYVRAVFGTAGYCSRVFVREYMSGGICPGVYVWGGICPCGICPDIVLCMCVLQRGHSGDGYNLASTLCKYDLRKWDLFVLC